MAPKIIRAGLVLGLLIAGASLAIVVGAAGASSTPAYSHVVIVVEENSGWAGNGQAPFLITMMAQGEYFANYHAVSHPSEPNYVAMFSGSTQGTDGSDSCITSSAPSLAGEAVAAGVTIDGYFQGLTSNVLYGCRHNPFSQFTDATAYASDFTAFPSNYATLPQISFVVPNTQDDMGDNGTIADGDTWDQANLAGYAQWAKANNSLLIFVSDESSTDPNYHTNMPGENGNNVPLIAVGAGVTPGSINREQLRPLLAAAQPRGLFRARIPRRLGHRHRPLVRRHPAGADDDHDHHHDHDDDAGPDAAAGDQRCEPVRAALPGRVRFDGGLGPGAARHDLPVHALGGGERADRDHEVSRRRPQRTAMRDTEPRAAARPRSRLPAIARRGHAGAHH